MSSNCSKQRFVNQSKTSVQVQATKKLWANIQLLKNNKNIFETPEEKSALEKFLAKVQDFLKKKREVQQQSLLLQQRHQQKWGVKNGLFEEINAERIPDDISIFLKHELENNEVVLLLLKLRQLKSNNNPSNGKIDELIEKMKQLEKNEQYQIPFYSSQYPVKEPRIFANNNDKPQPSMNVATTTELK